MSCREARIRAAAGAPSRCPAPRPPACPPRPGRAYRTGRRTALRVARPVRAAEHNNLIAAPATIRPRATAVPARPGPRAAGAPGTPVVAAVPRPAPVRVPPWTPGPACLPRWAGVRSVPFRGLFLCGNSAAELPGSFLFSCAKRHDFNVVSDHNAFWNRPKPTFRETQRGEPSLSDETRHRRFGRPARISAVSAVAAVAAAAGAFGATAASAAPARPAGGTCGPTVSSQHFGSTVEPYTGKNTAGLPLHAEQLPRGERQDPQLLAASFRRSTCPAASAASPTSRSASGPSPTT